MATVPKAGETMSEFITIGDGKYQHYCTMIINPAIRWLVKGVGNKILQQASMCCGCGKVAWEDVKEVTEAEEVNP